MSAFKLAPDWEDGARRLLPPHMIDSWLRYWNHRVPPGGFLRAILENNLVEAWQKADSINQGYFAEYVECLLMYVPGRPNGWGSAEAVEAWLREKD